MIFSRALYILIREFLCKIMGQARINNKHLRTAGTVPILNAYELVITGIFFTKATYTNLDNDPELYVGKILSFV